MAYLPISENDLYGPLDDSGAEFRGLLAFPDPEWEFVDDVIDEIDGIGLRVPFINLHGAHAGSGPHCVISA